MASSISEAATADPVTARALALGDDALIAAQRLTDWLARAPEIEEDVALANIALDLLGQARSLLTYAGSRMTPGRDEDELAYFRDLGDFRCVHLVQRPMGDFAQTMARLLIFSAYQHELYSRLVSDADQTLAAIAAKAIKEVSYHRDHAELWVLRLGDGTESSHERMQAGLELEWPYAAELFEQDATLRAGFDDYLDGVLSRATLTRPELPDAVTGGRRGVHSEEFGFVLAELQHLARSHPGASW